MRMTNLFIIFIMKRSMFSYLLSYVLLKKTQLISRWTFRISLTYLFVLSSFMSYQLLYLPEHITLLPFQCVSSCFLIFFFVGCLVDHCLCLCLFFRLATVSAHCIWPLYRLSTFHLWLLITPLVSYKKNLACAWPRQ